MPIAVSPSLNSNGARRSRRFNVNGTFIRKFHQLPRYIPGRDAPQLEAPFRNPEGIPSFSPALPGRSPGYAGFTPKKNIPPLLHKVEERPG
jgi:hypothetical protein